MIKLDFCGDSASVCVQASPEEQAILEGTICGASFSGEFAFVGEVWTDELSDEENDIVWDRWRKAVICEIEIADLQWEEE